MYQSSTRKNFLDILLDPTAIAILGSIALHATLGVSLPFFTHPEPETKKVDPGTVKVVELTPNELQRIPQVPPTPIPQALPPISQPITPSSQTAPPPSTPSFSTAPATIPFSPIRIPLEQIIPKPLPAKKAQKAIPQKQPIAPIFDRNISFKPAPKPSKPPIQKIKPLSQPKPKSTPVATQPIVKKTKPSPAPVSPAILPPDDDGSDVAPTTPSPTPSIQAQQPAITPQPSITPQPAKSLDPSSNNNSGYAKAANAKILEYLTKYPDIKQYPPKTLSQKYPPGIPCPKVKQPPFIVLMVAFDKVPQGQDPISGSSISPLLENEKPYINGDPAILANKKLLDISVTEGLADATESDKKRPEADKGRPVMYQYRVQFDPASCKN
jgi:hypothetical protein